MTKICSSPYPIYDTVALNKSCEGLFPTLRLECKNVTLFQTKMVKIYTFLCPKRLRNHMFWGHTYLYTCSAYRGAPPPPRGGGGGGAWHQFGIWLYKLIKFFVVLSLKRERLTYGWLHSRAVLWSNSKNKRAEIVDYNGTNTQQSPIAFVERAITSQHPLLVASYMKHYETDNMLYGLLVYYK